ncbi:PaaI family thioesterase [uncultured Methanomethylovorans sp.]|uniref:PaaI family thioesterase n=1 Tax=uncultured Methanomethylovorans sp. TaxID=183759 RepID=UPI002AA8D8BB|nr:PaaI family thioesterase [uncultured Methanomethylovorans sp.]
MKETNSSILKLVGNDHFSTYCHIELLDVSPGYAKARMLISNEHLNGFGTVHGGAIFTLADFVFGSASTAHGRIAVAINCSIAYLKAAKQGYLTAEAKEIYIGYKLATYIVTITNEENEPIATFQGTAYRKGEKIEELIA